MEKKLTNSGPFKKSTHKHSIYPFASFLLQALMLAVPAKTKGMLALVDYIGNYRQAFLAAELYNFPCFPDTVPDLAQLLAKDAKATPPDKYKVLTDVLDWTTNVGHPGHANAAIAEIINTGLISTMFAQAATGKVKPDEALRQADAEVQRIYQQWKARGKL